MWLNLQVGPGDPVGGGQGLQVGERVKLAAGHDHNLVPAYTTAEPLTERSVAREGGKGRRRRSTGEMQGEGEAEAAGA
jgi:hypothetical protein